VTAGTGQTWLWRQCVALAGALAEAGVQDIALTLPDGTRRVLVTRQTDLAGTLGSASIGAVLEVAALGLAVVRDPDRLRVARAEGPMALAIETLLATR